LDGLDLELGHGDRLGLFGVNGSGKSTLLNLIMGLIPWQNGTLLLDGDPISDQAGFALLRRRVGLVMQQPENMLFCPTVREDCRFGPLNFGQDPTEIDRSVDAILETLGIAHLAEVPPWRLSGGQAQAAALAAVLACTPDLLLLDEPTTGLDQDTLDRLGAFLTETDTALLVISHDHAFLRQVCDRHLHLRDGRLHLRDGRLHLHH
jgi:cobalt/nickel transport system ATP-binding protein